MIQEPVEERIRNIHIKYYAAACTQLGIPFSLEFRTRILRITTKNGNNIFCYKAATPLNHQSSVTLSKDKHALHQALAPYNFPLPTQLRIKSTEELLRFFNEHRKIVVKPADSHGGKGVTVLPKEFELEAAFERARKHSSIIISETYMSGRNYRLLVLDDNVLAVSLRLPPLIIGDGKTDIQTLLDDFNIENKAKGMPKVPDSSYTWSIVASQGFQKNEVPPVGKEILLRLTANLSLGGSIKDVTSECDPSYKELAVRVAKQLGLRLVGIDLIAEDITLPNKPVIVLEANAAPGLRIHYKDPNGEKLHVALPIISAINEL